MKKKIILYEHQKLYVNCVQHFLENNKISTQYEIKGITDYEDLANSITEKDTLLFLNINGINTLDVCNYIEKFLNLNPSLKIIVNSQNPEARIIKKLFDKGIKSYLGGDSSKEELLEALHMVIDGKIYVNNNAKKVMVNYICSVEDNKDTLHNGLEDLTAREKDVLVLICDGLRSKDIAEKLFISIHTVESHRRNMMLKLNINNSPKLVKFAIENRLVEF